MDLADSFPGVQSAREGKAIKRLHRENLPNHSAFRKRNHIDAATIFARANSVNVVELVIATVQRLAASSG